MLLRVNPENLMKINIPSIVCFHTLFGVLNAIVTERRERMGDVPFITKAHMLLLYR